MQDNFKRAIVFVLRHEGGYVNDPRDPGGETKFGISKRAYPQVDIMSLTVNEAKDIYKTDYWDRAGCDGLAWPLCLVVLDTAVNCGVDKAREFSDAAPNWTDYLFLRIEHYCNLRKPEYLRGWINRVLDLWKEAKNGMA